MREQGRREADKVLSQFDKYPIEVVDVDRGLTRVAARLKGSVRIAYADCFAAALALKLNAPLVTGDPEFRKLADEVSIHWINTKE